MLFSNLDALCVRCQCSTAKACQDSASEPSYPTQPVFPKAIGLPSTLRLYLIDANIHRFAEDTVLKIANLLDYAIPVANGFAAVMKSYGTTHVPQKVR